MSRLDQKQRDEKVAGTTDERIELDSADQQRLLSSARELDRSIPATGQQERGVSGEPSELALLAAASQRLAAPLDLRSTLEVAAAIASEAVLGRSEIHWLGEHGQPERLASWGLCADGGDGSESAGELRAALQSVIDSGQSALLSRDERESPPATAAAQPAHRSAIVALAPRGSVEGALVCERYSPTPFSNSELEWIEELGRRIAAAIELARLNETARNAVRAGERLISVASHELRSPLGTLRLALQVGLSRMRRGEALEPAVLEKALALTDRMSTLIGEVLSSAELASPEREPLDVDELLAQTADAFRSRRPKRQVARDGSSATRRLLGDRRQLGRVLEYLLDNAAKFSPENTPILLSAADADREVVIGIADQGIGIPKAEQALVFERFVRGSNANTVSTQGMGLGLCLSRNIVTAHGGRIWVESDPGQGSVFRIALPAAPGAPQSAARRESPDG